MDNVIRFDNDLIPMKNITVFRCIDCGHGFALPTNKNIRVAHIRCTNCKTSSGLNIVHSNPCPPKPEGQKGGGRAPAFRR